MCNIFRKVDGESLNPLVKTITDRSFLHFVANATLNKKNQDTLKESELLSKSSTASGNSYSSAEVNANNAVVHLINSLAVELTNSTSKQMSAKLEHEPRKLNTAYNPTLPEQNSNTECIVSTQAAKKYNTQSAAEGNENNTDKQMTNPFTNTPPINPSSGRSITDAAYNTAMKRKSQSPEKDNENNTNTAIIQVFTRRKSQTVIKGHGNFTTKRTNRQLVAAAVSASAYEAGAEAALRRENLTSLHLEAIPRIIF